MKIIAHRGNLNGPGSDENAPSQIERCIELGYEVEIDLWYEKGRFILGHDGPVHTVSLSFLEKYACRLWIHCKNPHALFQMSGLPTFQYFWHNQDHYTLTSKQIIWAYPGMVCNRHSVVVLPERHTNLSDFGNLLKIYEDCYGICTDYPELIKGKY